MVKALMNGRGDDLIDLAKTNLWEGPAVERFCQNRLRRRQGRFALAAVHRGRRRRSAL
jgi:hypothetical protein